MKDGDGNPAFPSPEGSDMLDIAGPAQLFCLELDVDGPLGGVAFERTDIL
ncbi:MAG TPA: hypothetical protein VG755_21140 [Nannocystaceae bacterium]|nr:hypothetical protein [Nannocystaceae bacterium]